jgi:site-specific DNA recombinase
MTRSSGGRDLRSLCVRTQKAPGRPRMTEQQRERACSSDIGDMSSAHDHAHEASAATDSANLDRVSALFYGRASQDRSGQRSSVTTQEAKFDKRAEREDWSVLEKIVDNDVSASKRGAVRPNFERMMKRLTSGKLRPDVLVVNDVSRLFRNRRDKIRLEELIESGVHIVDMRYGIDTRTQMGRIVFGIASEMAIDRAIELAEYQRDYHERRRSAGQPSKSSRGVGHRPVTNDEGRVVGFEIDEEAARAIRWAVARLKAGASLRFVERAWNDPSSPYYLRPPRGGKRWHGSTVRGVVTSARIAGYIEDPMTDDQGNLIDVRFIENTDGTLPAIVKLGDVIILRERFEMNSLRVKMGSNVGRTAKYLLSGIAVCCDCGAPMYGFKATRKNKPSKTRYQCQACRASGTNGTDGPTIEMEWLDEFVVGATFERLRSGVLTDLLKRASAAKGVDEIARQIAAEEDDLRQLDELIQGGKEISVERYVNFTQAKERRIAELKDDLAEALDGTAEGMIPMLPDDLVERLEEYWEDADILWRRRLVSLCWAKVVIHRAPRRGRMTAADSLKRVELVPRDCEPVTGKPHQVAA